MLERRDDGDRKGSGEATVDDLDPVLRRSEAKRRFLEGSLERGKTQVRVDARRAGVRVPARFATEPALALNLSWRFPDARMVVNERGVAATLKFSGEPFRCAIPWRAMWGVLATGDDTVQVWPLDLPAELGGPGGADDTSEVEPVEAPPPRLVAVKGGLAAVAEEIVAPPDGLPDRDRPSVVPVVAVEPVAETGPETRGAPVEDLPAVERPPAVRAPFLRVVK